MWGRRTFLLTFCIASFALAPGLRAEEEGPGVEAKGETHEEEGKEAGEAGANAILFLFFAIVIGLCFRRLFNGFIIPYSGLLLLMGLAIGIVDQYADWHHLGEGIEAWKSMAPTLFLLIFLPILLFGSGMALDWHTFFRNLSQILILAFPGVGIHTCLVAIVFKYVFPYSWSWKEAFLYGSIISATDPVAVVAIMKEVGASKRLGHLIEGESLLNDGSAFVFFLIFFDMVKGEGRGTAATVGYFFKLVFGATALGIVFGIGLTLFLVFVYRDSTTEILTTITVAYLCFWVAEEILEVSGVLAVVVLAIYTAALGKRAISPESVHPLHIVWDVLEFSANTIVFVYAGVLISNRIHKGHSDNSNLNEGLLNGKDWGWAILNWVFLNIIRFVTLSILKPILNLFGDGFSWADVILGTWAGLRGAVGLALALLIDLETNDKVNPRYATIVVFFVGTMAVITIILQGSTMPLLLRLLGVTKKSPAQLRSLLLAAKEVEEYPNKHLQHLKTDAILGEPDWEEVLVQTSLDVGALLPSDRAVKRLISSHMAEHGKQAEGALYDVKVDGAEEATDSHAAQEQHLRSTMRASMQQPDTSGQDKGTSTGTRQWRSLKNVSRQDILSRRRNKHTKKLQSVTSAADVLHTFEELNQDALSKQKTVKDIRGRYLAAMKAVYNEGVDKGYLNNDQRDELVEVIDKALDRVDEKLDDWKSINGIVKMPQYMSMIVSVLVSLGRVVPYLDMVGHRLLFINMESDLRMLAAFVYAHGQAFKGLKQISSMAEQEHSNLEDIACIQTATIQIIDEGQVSQKMALEQLSSFKTEFPEVVRAIKTRDTSKVVLGHKAKFVKSLHKAGLLKSKEANAIQALIYQKLKYLYFHPALIDLPDVHSIIRRHPLFAHMDVEAVKKVLAAGHPVLYQAGNEVMKLGSPPNRVQFIVRGTVVKQSMTGEPAHFTSIGAAVGLTEVLTGRKRMRSMKADTAVETFALPAKFFLDMCAENRELELKAYQLAAASMSLSSDFPTFSGCSYDELAQGFSTCTLSNAVNDDGVLIASDCCLLVKGNVRALLSDESRDSTANDYCLYEPPVGSEGEEVRAPAFLTPGTYPVVTAARVLSLPEGIRQSPMDHDQETIRNMSLFHRAGPRTTNSMIHIPSFRGNGSGKAGPPLRASSLPGGYARFSKRMFQGESGSLKARQLAQELNTSSSGWPDEGKGRMSSSRSMNPSSPTALQSAQSRIPEGQQRTDFD